MPTLRTARDVMHDGMIRKGLEEAPSVRFELQDGRIVNVETDNHPVLDLPADQVRNMSFHPSAEGAR